MLYSRILWFHSRQESSSEPDSHEAAVPLLCSVQENTQSSIHPPAPAAPFSAQEESAWTVPLLGYNFPGTGTVFTFHATQIFPSLGLEDCGIIRNSPHLSLITASQMKG